VKKENVIKLSQEERTNLENIVKHGENKVRVMRRAQMLLWSDEGRSDVEIAELLDTTPLTVSRTRARWVKEQQLADKAKPGRKRRLDGKQEAFLVALACSEAPEGRDEWTMQLLADKLVALGIVEQAVSDDTVGRILKKTSLSRG
jgi:transposase